MQFYHFDALGNTVLLTRPDGDYGFGRLHQTYYYGAWGETYFYGSPDDNPYQYVGQLGYYTHYQDATLGMLQLGVRFYEPGTGRFGQRDAIDTGPNLYVYGKNNAATRVDPSGRLCRTSASTEMAKPASIGGTLCRAACAAAGAVICGAVACSCTIGTVITVGGLTIPCTAVVISACAGSAGLAVVCADVICPP
jgi:RHS repeat-associated protein